MLEIVGKGKMKIDIQCNVCNLQSDCAIDMIVFRQVEIHCINIYLNKQTLI